MSNRRKKLFVVLALANIGLFVLSEPARAGDGVLFGCDTCIGGGGQNFACCVEEFCSSAPQSPKCCTRGSDCNGAAS